MKAYMAKRRKERREKLLDMGGGKCVECGSKNDLHIDHKDPRTRSFTLSGAGLDKSWDKILDEFKKCQLLCSKCHMKKNVESDWSRVVDHGQGLTGKKNCRCKLCAPLKDAYNKKYK